MSRSLRIASISAGLTLVFAVAGLAQDGDAKYEETLRGLVTHLADISKILEGVTNEPSAQAAAPQLKEKADGYLALRKKSEEIPPPNAEVRDRLAKKYRPEFEKARKEVVGQIARVQRVPGGLAALQEIRGVFEKNGK